MDKYTDLHTGFNDPVTNIGGEMFESYFEARWQLQIFLENYKSKKTESDFYPLEMWPVFQNSDLRRKHFFIFFFGKLCTMIVTE